MEKFILNRILKNFGKTVLLYRSALGIPSTTTLNIISFSKAKVDHLGNLFSASSTTSSSFITQIGTSSHFFANLINLGEIWIIDSGATDHITNNA